MHAEIGGVVPAPWTPLVVDGHSLACWNRVYDFGEGPLPARINSGGQELLASPMRLAVKVAPTA
jgi:hypothetical protein